VILYADTVTLAMQTAIDETLRRRKKQEAYNKIHGITPETVKKKVTASIQQAAENRKRARSIVRQDPQGEKVTEAYLKTLEEEMLAAAENLEFERAAALRDKILRMRDRIGEPIEDEPNRMVGSRQKKRGRKK
jgi:excinuclease ABC subunit B